ncbi:hypothetical protein [Hymenobacter sp. CRA2]|uniref:hypothetical protein n=1 Tax=Hymenobacter sp. CRA2 TaxID=1955620 RepID=UPI00098F9CFB|nr:hypothetical protein [Hymenobacter sp. CRA2]OON68745.1 hypothetical protein B0919_11180 [Hymenobacter sp. CRA2]
MSVAASTAEFDFLDLGYRPDLRVLTVRWLRPVSFVELQIGFRAALALNEHHHAALWLIDVRRRTELEAASSAWVADHLLPDAAAAVAPGTLHVAYLLSPMRADELNRDAGLRTATASAQSAAQPYRLATFIDEGPALQWLLSRS